MPLRATYNNLINIIQMLLGGGQCRRYMVVGVRILANRSVVYKAALNPRPDNHALVLQHS